MSKIKTIKPFWELGVDDILSVFNTSFAGISQGEAKSRLNKYGFNIIGNNGEPMIFQIFFKQFKNPLILILLLALVVSFFLGEFLSTFIIFIIIFLSSCLSFYQEYKSEKTISLLKKRVSSDVWVFRDGRKINIHVTDVVVGDMVFLSAGGVVPADIRLVKSNCLLVDESSLTGESFPVEKNSNPQIVRDYLPQIMKNLVFMGTYIIQGSGLGVVVATGLNTEFGKNSQLLLNSKNESEFQKSINSFGFFLFKIIILFTLLIFLFLAFLKGNWLEALMFSLAIAVGISPELLPMIITINLSQTARNLAKKSVIVKQLMAVENLGNADVLCTDKTGTLTEGKIELYNYFDLDDVQDDYLITLSQLCNSLSLKNGESFSNPLDEAIIDYAKKHKLTKKIKDYSFINITPFDFNKRIMSVVVKSNNELPQIIVKGAVEEILDACTYILYHGKKRKISYFLNNIKQKIKNLESAGFKVLLVAYDYLESESKKNNQKNLIFSGFLVFNDPPKRGSKKSLDAFRDLGVSIKLLTGDSLGSALFLAKQTGFLNPKAIIGNKLSGLSDLELQKVVSDFDVFAKVTPEHKLKIVKALKDTGHSVAFLGDGINDAPALKMADVGISVNSATDIAREAADVVLLRKSLPILIEGIRGGRRNFNNTMKYIICTIASNYGNMFSVVGASIFLPFIPMLPIQVLLLNFLSDLPMLSIAYDNVDEESINNPKKWDINHIKKFMNYFGLVSSFFDFITFIFLILIAKATMPLFQTGWFWQSFLTEVLLIFVIRTKRIFFKSRPANILLLSSFITLLIIFLFIYAPIGRFLGFEPIPVWILSSIIGISLIYFVIVEWGKNKFYNKYGL